MLIILITSDLRWAHDVLHLDRYFNEKSQLFVVCKMESNLFKEKEIPGLIICARQTDHALIQVYLLLSHITEIFNDKYCPRCQPFV